MWYQKHLSITPKHRGFHLITDEVLEAIPEINQIGIGILHLFIKHTSASLSINEDADPTVRQDLESHFNVMVPERAAYYRHTYEGDDDMPAHIKAVLIGASLSLPVSDGKLCLGTWQGIYLCEHRNQGGARNLVATLQGE